MNSAFIILWTVFAFLLVLAVQLCRTRETFDYYSPMDLDDIERKRMEIYLRGLNTKQVIRIKRSDVESLDEVVSFDVKDEFFVDKRTKQDNEIRYDLLEIYRRYNVDTQKKIRVATWADSIDWHRTPTIAKTRHIHAQTVMKRFCVLLRLRSRIHFDSIRPDPVPFERKRNMLLWRGGPSGPGFHNEYPPELMKPSREDCLKRWCHNPTTQDEIDVGLIKKWKYEHFKQYLKNELEVGQMLEYKYLLSIEGNDVASNLKWMLASNSLILMHQPYVESWFAESLLRPYVHYVPVKDDFSDLYIQKQWCDRNPEKCKKIIERAQAYVRPFRNIEREYYLSFRVLQRYMHFVDIEIVADDDAKKPVKPAHK